MESILGNASRIVQPPLSIRPSGLRKSKSQDTDDRRPIEGVLTSEGVHRDIKIDDDLHRVLDGTTSIQTFHAQATGEKGSTASSATLVATTDNANVIQETLPHRPPRTEPIVIPTPPVISAPSTPTIGKGQAHDPLEDTLFLNIGTGEDCPSQLGSCPIVSESPSNADMNVYEAAYQEEIARISKAKESLPPSRRPTLYLTRRVENIKSLRENKDLIDDAGRSRNEELKSSIKTLVKKAQKSVDERAEAQRLEGREDLLSRGWRNVKELKDLVDEAREIVREEERRDGRRGSEGRIQNVREREGGSRSRSGRSTPTSASREGGVAPGMGLGKASRSGTPVALVAEE